MPTTADVVKLNFLLFHCEFLKGLEGKEGKKLVESSLPPLSDVIVREMRRKEEKNPAQYEIICTQHPRMSTNTVKPTNTTEGAVTNTLTARKRMKSPKKRKPNVNETKNLFQTFLSRSTDKVLQPRNKNFWFLFALLVQIRKIRVRATTKKVLEVNAREIK